MESSAGKQLCSRLIDPVYVLGWRALVVSVLRFRGRSVTC